MPEIAEINGNYTIARARSVLLRMKIRPPDQPLCWPLSSATDRKRFLDFGRRRPPVNGRCSTFVITGVHDHFEFSVAIQIQNRAHIIIIRRVEMPRVRMNFARDYLSLKFPVNHASQ